MKATRTLDAAIKQGYVVMRASYRMSNYFFQYCESTDAPFVRVRLKTTFAMVEVDLIGQSYRMGEVCRNEVEALLKAHHVGNWPNRLAGSSRTFIYSPRIPIDQADTVARAMIEILAKPGYREPNTGHFSPEIEALDRALATGMPESSRSHPNRSGSSGLL